MTLNGDVNTNQAAGITLNIHDAIRKGSLTATNGGPLVTNFSGSLSVLNTSPIQVGSVQTTATSGGILQFQGTIITDAGGILLNAPLYLIGQTILDTSAANGNMSFFDSVTSSQSGGPFAMIAKAGSGNITFSGDIGSSSQPLAYIEIDSANNVTATSFTGGYLLQNAGSGTTSFTGPVTITSSNGLDLAGNSFAFTGGISTFNGGPLKVVNTAALTLQSTVNLSGPLLQTGSGQCYLQGTITANASAIAFASPIALTSDLSIGSNGGNVTISSTIDGAHSLILASGSGDVNVLGQIGALNPLVNCTISGHNILLSGIGSSTNTLSGTLSVAASELIFLEGQYYAAHAQQYNCGVDVNVVYPGLEIFKTNGGNIGFNSGELHINNYDLGTNMSVVTSGGEFNFIQIFGTAYPALNVDTTTGYVSFGGVSASGAMGSIAVYAGSIAFAGDTYCTTGSFTANYSLSNLSSPVTLSSTADMTFNSLSSNVASVNNPLVVNAGGQVFAGSSYLAAFDGTTSDGTIHPYSPHPACVIYFNGVKIADCGSSSTLPPVPATLFATPGFNSSFYNLANDFYFLPSSLDDSYFKKASTFPAIPVR